MAYIRKRVLLSIKLSLFISYRQFMEIKRKKKKNRIASVLHKSKKYDPLLRSYKMIRFVFNRHIFNRKHMCYHACSINKKKKRNLSISFVIRKTYRSYDYLEIGMRDVNTLYPRHIGSSFVLFSCLIVSIG